MISEFYEKEKIQLNIRDGSLPPPPFFFFLTCRRSAPNLRKDGTSKGKAEVFIQDPNAFLSSLLL